VGRGDGAGRRSWLNGRLPEVIVEGWITAGDLECRPLGRPTHFSAYEWFHFRALGMGQGNRMNFVMW
jgi:hypothetical protein